MSYLHPVRLHFSGRFRADVSTVNNSTIHFDDANFNPDIQRPLSGSNDLSNWQPAGTGAWRLLDGQVTRACRADGTAASTPAQDIAVGAAVREATDRSSAKIVDLDPDQQGVSMIFGLTVRLVDGQGRMLMQGGFEPAAFFDLRSHRSSGGGDAGRSAYFQSVLTDVEWGDVTASPCLTQMKQASGKTLSIRFMTDGYFTGGPKRGYGRMVGTIGPYLPGEPRTFLAGRHLRVQTAAPPADRSLEYAQLDCVVDAGRRKILLDAGNVLKVTADGDFVNIGDLTLTAGNGFALGTLNYNGPGNYKQTAGIYELPQGRTLTDAELAAVANAPLRVMLQAPGGGAPTAFAAENGDGVYVRAEQFVFRLDSGISASTDLIVTRFGAPFANATPTTAIVPFFDNDQLPLPEIATAAKTDTQGRAQLTITAVDPKKPRGFIDGVVYGILCWVEESQVDLNVVLNAESNFVSVLVFDPKTVLTEPGWDDVRPILQLYADLYPRPHGPDPYAPFDGLPPSRPVVNLREYESVAAMAHRIRAALERPIDHPDHMPVTRDLSGPKRALLLNWLRNIGADGLPQRTGASAGGMMAAAAAAPKKSPARFSVAASALRLQPRRHEPPTSS